MEKPKPKDPVLNKELTIMAMHDPVAYVDKMEAEGKGNDLTWNDRIRAKTMKLLRGDRKPAGK